MMSFIRPCASVMLAIACAMALFSCNRTNNKPTDAPTGPVDAGLSIISIRPGSGYSQSADAIFGTGSIATFNGLGGIAVDRHGNIYVPDQSNNAIRMLKKK